MQFDSEYDFSTFPPDHDLSSYEECRSWIAENASSVVAIFDIGTRAARLLVAPRQVPVTLDETSFWSRGLVFNLGQAVSQSDSRLEIDSRQFQNVLTFVASHIENLKACNVTEISLIGTAVFRWLSNASEVKAEFRKQTGYDLEIISQDEESRLSLVTLPDVLARRSISLDIQEQDMIMLIDQGGGSLEITWMRWADKAKVSPAIGKRLFEELGTESLRRSFFRMDSDLVDIEPAQNRASISRQTEMIHRLAKMPLQSWFSAPKMKAGQNLHVFAVGSAITSLIPESSYNRHGREIYLHQISEEIQALLDRMQGSRQQVRSLYKYLEQGEGLQKSQWTSRHEADKQLAMLYGLPVIKQVLEKVDVDRLRLSGYGLRYAYYIWHYLHTKIEPDEGEDCIFVSYARSEQSQIISELRLFRAHGYRFWYDHGIEPGKDWNSKIVGQILKSSMLICFLSAQSTNSEWVALEIEIAIKFNKPVIIVRMDDAEIPDELEQLIARYQFLNRRELSDHDFIRALDKVVPSASLVSKGIAT